MKLRIVHKGLLFLCLPLMVQGMFFIELFHLIGETERSMARQTAHINMSKEMNFVIVQFCRTLAVCGSGTAERMMPVKTYQALMMQHLARLDSYIKNTSEDYQQVYNSSRKLITAQIHLLELLQSEQGSDLDTMSKLMATKQMIAGAEAAGPAIYRAWENEEQLLEKERIVDQESREQIKRLVLAASVFDFALAVIFIIVFVQNITRRLNLLVSNARVLPNSVKLPNKVSGSDEIAFLDQAMHDASEELIKAAGYRRSLLEMMAHDLRNPLMAIGVAFEVMLKSARDGEVRSSDGKVRSLRQSLKQITILLDDLLALDRIEASELKLELTLFNSGELIKDACDLVRAQLDEKSMQLEVKMEPLEIIADRNRVLQILGNLLGNAVRYSPGGSLIRLGVRRNGNSAIFTVADQGPGIESGLHESLFEKFFQANQAKKLSGGLGYGLGLAICKQIVLKHGGEIGVDSTPGRGATFWFTLPLDEELDD